MTPPVDGPTPTDVPTPTEEGETRDSPPAVSFTYRLIDGRIVHAQGSTVVDIDDDSDLDVVSSLSLTDAIYLYLNGGDSSGGGDGSRWTAVPIAGDGTIVAMHTAVADFDNDGDQDVAAVGLFDRSCVFCAPGEVIWYENPGNVLGVGWPTT